jgi:hypothetical protein
MLIQLSTMIDRLLSEVFILVHSFHSQLISQLIPLCLTLYGGLTLYGDQLLPHSHYHSSILPSSARSYQRYAPTRAYHFCMLIQISVWHLSYVVPLPHELHLVICKPSLLITISTRELEVIMCFVIETTLYYFLSIQRNINQSSLRGGS